MIIDEQDIQDAGEAGRLTEEILGLLVEKEVDTEVGITALAMGLASACHYAGIAQEDALRAFANTLKIIYRWEELTVSEDDEDDEEHTLQ